MKVINLKGKLVSLNISKYRINWDKKRASDFQFGVKQFLKPFWEASICAEECRIPGTLLRLDLVNFSRKIIVEASWSQHTEFNKHFHQNSRINFLFQIKRDELKVKFAELNNFTFIEIYPADLPLTLNSFISKFGIHP